METKLIHYIGMVFVVSEMPQDKPVMSGVVMQTGELRAFWRDPEYRGDDKMYLEFDAEIGKAMIIGEIPIPVFAFIHPDNEESNKFTAKMGLQMEKIVRDNIEWNAWFLSAERTKAIVEFRKRFVSVQSDEERIDILKDYTADFEKAVRDKNKLEEIKVK